MVQNVNYSLRYLLFSVHRFFPSVAGKIQAPSTCSRDFARLNVPRGNAEPLQTGWAIGQKCVG